MNDAPLKDYIVEAFDSLSSQLQTAARYILDRPHDVALLSMREQARQAGVQPATMTRLAKQLGLDGYEAVRALYAEAVRNGDLGFAGKAGAHVATQRLSGDKALIAEMVGTLDAQIAMLAEPRSLDRLAAAAALLSKARRIFCLGLRASHPVAWHLHYVLSLFGERSVLLDGIAGVGADAACGAQPQDVLVVVSVLPYTRATVEVTQHVAARGVSVIAITDSEVAPLAQVARQIVLVPAESPSFFHTMAPAFVAAEILAALVAGRGGKATLAALRRMDEHLSAMGVHIDQGVKGRAADRYRPEPE